MDLGWYFSQAAALRKIAEHVREVPEEAPGNSEIASSKVVPLRC
jgi:hypothetical protein